MIVKSVAEMANMIGAAVSDGWGDTRVQGVSIDTRTLKPGNLYIPIAGARFNGHDFAVAAIEQGASAMLWNREEPNPPSEVPVILVEDTTKALQMLAAAYRKQLSLQVIGITGSNGKTSTKDILAALLSVKYKTQKTAGNLNNHLGVPLTLLALKEDTEFAVIEMGMSNLGEIRFLGSLARPNIAIITNASEVHLGDLHTRERILQAKLEIAEALTAEDLLVYNGDHDGLRQEIASKGLPCQMVSFGEGAVNDVSAKDIRVTKQEVSFRVRDVGFHLPVLGRHQAVNALAAIAAARSAGFTDGEIREGLAQVRLTGMRNEWVECGSFAIMNDTYKSNPTSVRAALELLYTLQPFQQKIVVLGEMVELGEESVQLHREIGMEALKPEHLDYVFTIGSMARHMAEAAREHFPPGRVFFCEDLDDLLGRLKGAIKENGLLLVKGSRILGLEQVVEEVKGWAGIVQ
jgi:UDP-N-acetylmuramoyl-tripeptide--D-alanyl-D-alanine ligase